MNQSRGKASTNASRQNKSQKSSQASKTQTDASEPRRRRNNKRKQNMTFNLQESQSKRGRLGLSSQSKSVPGRKPQLIEEDEYIAEINGSVNFTGNVYPVNIGQSITFPWGSKIASLFEKYKFIMLEFYYKREVSEFATNGQTGKIMFSLDYDASDSAPTNKQQVLDTVPHVDGMPCAETLLLKVDCSKFDWLYVRPGQQANNTDIKTYDCGQLFTTTQGCANGNLIGELHVRYKCLVQTPILDTSGVAAGTLGSVTELFTRIPETITTTATPQAVFSVSPPEVINNGANLTIAPSGLITLPNGVYKISGQTVVTANSVNISAASLNYYQGATLGTIVITNYSADQASSVAGLNGHTSYFVTVYDILWDVGQFGPYFGAFVSGTFGSGSCSAKTRLLIEYLGST